MQQGHVNNCALEGASVVYIGVTTITKDQESTSNESTFLPFVESVFQLFGENLLHGPWRGVCGIFYFNDSPGFLRELLRSSPLSGPNIFSKFSLPISHSMTFGICTSETIRST